MHLFRRQLGLNIPLEPSEHQRLEKCMCSIDEPVLCGWRRQAGTNKGSVCQSQGALFQHLVLQHDPEAINSVWTNLRAHRSTHSHLQSNNCPVPIVFRKAASNISLLSKLQHVVDQHPPHMLNLTRTQSMGEQERRQDHSGKRKLSRLHLRPMRTCQPNGDVSQTRSIVKARRPPIATQGTSRL